MQERGTAATGSEQASPSAGAAGVPTDEPLSPIHAADDESGNHHAPIADPNNALPAWDIDIQLSPPAGGPDTESEHMQATSEHRQAAQRVEGSSAEELEWSPPRHQLDHHIGYGEGLDAALDAAAQDGPVVQGMHDAGQWGGRRRSGGGRALPGDVMSRSERLPSRAGAPPAGRLGDSGSN